MSAHSKDDSTAAEGCFYIGQLTWEAETKNTKAAPRAISEGRVLFAHKVGKANSTAAAAGAGDDDDGG
jgi:hypothetical protein